MVLTKSYNGETMYNSQLTTFIYVADCGSFNAAANKLFISSTAILKQINNLEEHLNLTLFQRTNHGVTLTPAGNVIYRYAKQMIEISEKALEEANTIQKTQNTTFRVGTSILNPCKLFMDLWYEVYDQFPNYKLSIVPFEDDHKDILSVIDSLGKNLDFIVGVCDSKGWLHKCNFLTLGTYQHCIAVPRNHPLAHKTILNPEDLFGYTIQMVKEGDSDVVDSIRAYLSKYPEIQIEDTSQHYDMNVFNHCIQKQNCMIIVECWKDVHPGLVTIPVNWDFPITYGVMYPLHPNQNILNLIHAIEKQISKKEHQSEF